MPPNQTDMPIPVFTITRWAAHTAQLLANMDGKEPGELISWLLAEELKRRGLAQEPDNN